MASAQGNLARVARTGTPLPPRPAPFQDPRGPKPDDRTWWAHPALDVPEELHGRARWMRLMRLALEECLSGEELHVDTPLILCSSNGAAHDFDPDQWTTAFDTRALLGGTPWAGTAPPIVSGSCASGLQGLWLAHHALAAGAREVVVLAVDILSAGSQRNFESLRVLARNRVGPWQPGSQGFLPGEAAVALRLRPPSSDMLGLRLHGPRLDLDLRTNDGLERLLRSAAAHPEVVLGQGTGPSSTDREELEALRALPPTLPISTPLHAFGHTLGASSLLSLALLLQGATVTLPADKAFDGRPMLATLPPRARALILCRALGGACGVLSTSHSLGDGASSTFPSEGACTRSAALRSAPDVRPTPVATPALRAILQDAVVHRPTARPEALLVRLEHPLLPPQRARFGDRLLPSAVLEMTPGHIALRIAREWGFSGPAMCIVGDVDAPLPLHIAASRRFCVVSVRGSGEQRDVRWSTRECAHTRCGTAD